MLAGQLYDCGDAELLTQWHRAKDLVRDYNSTDSADTLKKNQILNELLGGRGKPFGSPRRSLRTTATIFILETTVKSI